MCKLQRQYHYFQYRDVFMISTDVDVVASTTSFLLVPAVAPTWCQAAILLCVNIAATCPGDRGDW